VREIRAALSALLLLLTCIACSPSDYAFKGAAPRYGTEDGELLYRLSVNNPSLSFDGRYMAFDFHEFTSDGKHTLLTHMKLGLYDIQKQSIEIFTPPIPEAKWHSPSFDRAGKRLTFVAVCTYKICPNETLRTHIMIMDLETKNVAQITNNKQRIESWAFNYATSEAHRASGGPGLPRVMVRGYPVFSKDGTRIYHVSRPGPLRSSVFWLQSNPDYSLNVLDLSEASGTFQASDKLVQYKYEDAVIYKGDGRIAVLRGNNLVFSGRDAVGYNYKPLRTRKPTAFFYNLEENKLSVAIDKFNTPTDPRIPSKHKQRIYGLTASYDTGLIVGIRGQKHDIVTAWTGGQPEDLIAAEKLGIEWIGDVALSGDGRSLAILPNYRPPYVSPPEIDDFWMLDIDTGTLTKLPLRDLLRSVIKAAEKSILS